MSDDPNALSNVYRGNVGNKVLAFGILMFVVFLLSAFMISQCGENERDVAILVSAIWVVGVPLFFFYEHVVLFRKYGNPDQYEQFKRVQELAGKIWAGAIIVLAAFFAETFPG